MAIRTVVEGARVEVVGVAFASNASLSVSLHGAGGFVLVENCTFSKSIRQRALMISSSGYVLLRNSVFAGNDLGGGGEIHGLFVFFLMTFKRKEKKRKNHLE